MLCYFYIGFVFLDNDCFYLFGFFVDMCNNINYVLCFVVVNKYVIDFIKKKSWNKKYEIDEIWLLI